MWWLLQPTDPLETFSTPNKGYKINQVNDFFGVKLVHVAWTFDEPPANMAATTAITSKPLQVVNWKR